MAHPVAGENDDELGKHWGCDSQENLRDGGITLISQGEIGHPSPDL